MPVELKLTAISIWTPEAVVVVVVWFFNNTKLNRAQDCDKRLGQSNRIAVLQVCLSGVGVMQ